MEPRSIADLIDARTRWDAHASATDGIDRWCSRTPWMLGVDRAFGGPLWGSDTPGGGRDVADHTVIAEGAHGWVAFRHRALEDGSPALLPFDGVWAFGSPIVCDAGDDRLRRAFVDDAAAWVLAQPAWRVAAWSGIAEGSALEAALVAALLPHVRLLAGPDTVRCAASLEGGLREWEARRTREFRRNLRQGGRRADAAGITTVAADDDPPACILERLHTVERRSWKGLEGSGIESDDMATLYGALVHDLSGNGLRVSFAQLDGVDVGFILGGVLGGTYRGLQLSFADEVRALRIGNLLQWREVQRLCDQDVRLYDLGMDIPYKRNWGEQLVTTRTILAVR